MGSEKRVEKLNIRDLDPMEHDRFLKRWESVQSRFVDSPKGAVTEADDLVSSLMKARGYPVSLLNCAEFSSRLSEVAQTFDAISGIQFLVGGRGIGERWFLGTV